MLRPTATAPHLDSTEYGRPSLANEGPLLARSPPFMVGLPRAHTAVTLNQSLRAASSSRMQWKWAYERGVALDFSRPGKPTDNARAPRPSTDDCASSA
jgi:transposase InsO family protein